MRRALSHLRAALRLTVRIFRRWLRDRCPMVASALAFDTILTVVPIMALAFTVLRSTGSPDQESELMEFLAMRILPDLPDVARELQAFSVNISAGAAGLGGLLFTIVACFLLYASMERTFNDIWRVTSRRSMLRKFLTFYALVTLVPVVATLYLYWSSQLTADSSWAHFLGPLSIQFVALLLVNKLLPNTRVGWRAALTGALVTGLALESLNWGFVTFAKEIFLDNYTGIYGPFALVPVLLIWIYVSWLLVLLGAEIAHVVQNVRISEADERGPMNDEPNNGLVAAQLLAYVASENERGGNGVDRAELSQTFSLSTDVVNRIASRLKACGLLAEVLGDKTGFIPGRAPSAIHVSDILAAFRSTDARVAEGVISPALASLADELQDTRQVRIAALTLADILPIR